MENLSSAPRETWGQLIARKGFRTTQQVELQAGFNGGQLSEILNGKRRKLRSHNMAKLVRTLGESEQTILAAIYAEAEDRKARKMALRVS
ncbi:MAG: hypothetical protein ACOY94_19685 [Bacillota bacterium]